MPKHEARERVCVQRKDRLNVPTQTRGSLTWMGIRGNKTSREGDHVDVFSLARVAVLQTLSQLSEAARLRHLGHSHRAEVRTRGGFSKEMRKDQKALDLEALMEQNYGRLSR